MEAVVFEDSPLAGYLEGLGSYPSELVAKWIKQPLIQAPGDSGEEAQGIPSRGQDVSPSSSSSSPAFAPRGRPTIRARFRSKIPPPLRLAIPQNNTVAAIHNTCSKAVNSRLGRADNVRFLEHFRYTIVASQLLSGHSYLGQAVHGQSRDPPSRIPHAQPPASFTLAGAGTTALVAFAVAWLIHWTRGDGDSAAGKGRVLVFLALVVAFFVVGYAYIRRRWLQYLRHQILLEISEFVGTAHDFDAAAAGALMLVQEVELVSRGYRISNPLPPISRLEDRSQTRRCARLRKALRLCFADVIPRYNQACILLKPFAEDLDLEKYFDIYDVSDTDFSEAMLGYSETEFEDTESVRVLKILAARFHTSRKIFLCCLMALDAHGGKPDFLRWSSAFDEIRGIVTVTNNAEIRLRDILTEEESFPVPPTPKLPLTPGRERWRVQLRKLNSLSSGIRGLQAKLHVLREESDKNLNETEDVSELGTNLMIQYDSIGIDLKALMQEWEDGKAALASNIDRNERRISSISGILSPTTSLGGLTAVEEGGAAEALRLLNGEPRSRSSMDFSSSDAEEVFEAVAIPRQRSTMTREERISKMKDERIKRESMKSSADANTHMLRELESVIKMRPRGRATPAGRITSI